MNQFLAASIAAFAILAPVVANAVPASCYLDDNGTTLIEGPCQLEWLDHKGSSSINNGKFEGMAAHDNTGAMIGAFYELNDKTGQPITGTLEVMHKVGACWVNDTQTICAGKPGERIGVNHDGY